MQLKHLINDSNRALYKEISRHYPVQLKGSNNDAWSSSIKKNYAIVMHSKSSNPIASFTHELLHIDMQARGYRTLRAGVSLNRAVNFQLPQICQAVDAEFQHHRMYEAFLAMGFQSEDFYQDAARDEENYTKNRLLSKGQSMISISMIYLTMIAPGGTIPIGKIPELKAAFREYDSGSYITTFDEIDGIITDWKATRALNAEPYIIRFLKTIGCDDTWISYISENPSFPSDGFFVNRQFTENDVTAG